LEDVEYVIYTFLSLFFELGYEVHEGNMARSDDDEISMK